MNFACLQKIFLQDKDGSDSSSLKFTSGGAKFLVEGQGGQRAPYAPVRSEPVKFYFTGCDHDYGCSQKICLQNIDGSDSCTV